MDLDALERSVASRIGDRELKKFTPLLPQVAGEIDENEQVLGAASGTSVRRKECLLVATNKQIIVAEDGRNEAFPYDRLIDIDLQERWRKASLVLRMPGGLADVRGVHLDRAREIRQIVSTARRVGSRPNWTSPTS